MDERKWNERFLEMAKLVSTWSKDPSTKCGAVITRGKHIVSVGFNGFPSGCLDDKYIYNNRDRKYLRVIHAEVNAILTSKQDLNCCSIYVYPLPPCSNCAAAIIQSGIKNVFSFKPTGKRGERWKESLDESVAMFDEAGVKLYYKCK